jgi:hypothetical protein
MKCQTIDCFLRGNPYEPENLLGQFAADKACEGGQTLNVYRPTCSFQHVADIIRIQGEKIRASSARQFRVWLFLSCHVL